METSDERRPSAALINRDWFDAAERLMSSEDLGLVIVNACRYVWGLPEVAMKNQVQRVVFAMIKPALDSDLDKYRERCTRNAANARSQSQRVAASGSGSQRVGANTTTTPTPTTTTTQCLSPETKNEIEIEIEKFVVYGYFWSTGSKAIKDELNAFWSYYESLGWKNNKGALIVSKLAAARMWRRQFETGAAPNGADAWFSVVKSCRIPDVNAWHCFAGAERNETGAIVRLRCKASFWESMSNALPGIERALQGAWKVPAIEFQILS